MTFVDARFAAVLCARAASGAAIFAGENGTTRHVAITLATWRRKFKLMSSTRVVL